MLKKILCLIAFTLVLSVFDAPAMDSVDHSSAPKNELDSDAKINSINQKLINRQIEIILKTKKSRNPLKSKEETQLPKVSRL